MISWRSPPDKEAKAIDDAARLAGLKKKAEAFAEPFKSSVLWIPEGTPIPQDTLLYWITPPWDNHEGRATLAGDAAHPLPPRTHPPSPHADFLNHTNIPRS